MVFLDSPNYIHPRTIGSHTGNLRLAAYRWSEASNHLEDLSASRTLAAIGFSAEEGILSPRTPERARRSSAGFQTLGC